MEYKISQRPYPQNQYNLDYITAANAFKNPWTALGALVGNVLTKLYVDRGEQKLMDSMKDSIPQQQETTDAQITQQMLSNRPTQEETGNQALWDAYKKGNQIEIQPNYEIGLEALKNKSTDPLEIAALQKAIQLGNPQTNEPSQNDLNASQFEKDYLQKYINGNLPHMDAQGNLSNMGNAEALQAQRQQAAAQIAQNNIPKFSTEDWEAKMWAEGKKQGRPDYQIQAVIDRMKPQAQQAEKRYNDKMADYWGNQFIANLPLDNGIGGDSAARLNAIEQLYQYNPEKARILSTGNISPRETINMSQREKQNAINTQLKAAQIESRASGRSGGGNASVSTDGKIKMSTELRNKINDINVAREAGVISEEEASKRINAILGNTGLTSGQAKQNEEIADFDDTLTGYIESLQGQLSNGDIQGSGDTLEAITLAIDENPKLWAKLTDEQKEYVQNFRYLANGWRQDLGGYGNGNTFYKAISPKWREKFAAMGFPVETPNYNGQKK